MRIEADEVVAIVKPAGLLLSRTVELFPYHYGVVFVAEVLSEPDPEGESE